MRAALCFAPFLCAALVLGCGESGLPASNVPPSSTAQYSCDVTFSVINSGAFVALDADVDYSAAAGEFAPRNGRSDCQPFTAYGEINANRACDMVECFEGHMYLGYTGPLFEGPAKLARCVFNADTAPEPEDFRVSSIAASGEDLGSSEPQPMIVATNVSCHEGVTSPTISTTTTLPGCGATECPEGERCLNGACVADDRYEVVFHLDDDVRVSSLQLEVAYDCSLGTFIGTNDGTNCRLAPGVRALAVFNDRLVDDDPCSSTPIDQYGDPIGPFGAGIISVTGVPGPADLAICVFTASAPRLEAGDFGVQVVDGVDADGNFVSPSVGVSVR